MGSKQAQYAKAVVTALEKRVHVASRFGYAFLQVVYGIVGLGAYFCLILLTPPKNLDRIRPVLERSAQATIKFVRDRFQKIASVISIPIRGAKQEPEIAKHKDWEDSSPTRRRTASQTTWTTTSRISLPKSSAFEPEWTPSAHPLTPLMELTPLLESDQSQTSETCPRQSYQSLSRPDESRWTVRKAPNQSLASVPPPLPPPIPPPQARCRHPRSHTALPVVRTRNPQTSNSHHTDIGSQVH